MAGPLSISLFMKPNSPFAKVHPVKAEMSVSVPIQQAKAPINFDLIFVCRKKYGHAINEIEMTGLIQRSKEDTVLSLNKLREDQVVVGIGDIKLISMGILSRQVILGWKSRNRNRFDLSGGTSA